MPPSIPANRPQASFPGGFLRKKYISPGWFWALSRGRCRSPTAAVGFCPPPPPSRPGARRPLRVGGSPAGVWGEPRGDAVTGRPGPSSGGGLHLEAVSKHADADGPIPDGAPSSLQATITRARAGMSDEGCCRRRRTVRPAVGVHRGRAGACRHVCADELTVKDPWDREYSLKPLRTKGLRRIYGCVSS